MNSANKSLAMGIVLCLYPAAVRADVVVELSLSLTQLQILPSMGTVQFFSPLTASAFAQVFDSLGGADQQFNSVDNGAASATAATSLAHASAAASALSMTASTTAG